MKVHAPKAVKGWLLSNKAYLSVVYVLVVSNSQSSSMEARDRVGGGGLYLCEVGCGSFLVQAGDVNVVEAGLHPEEGLVGHLSIQVGV